MSHQRYRAVTEKFSAGSAYVRVHARGRRFLSIRWGIQARL